MGFRLPPNAPGRAIRINSPETYRRSFHIFADPEQIRRISPNLKVFKKQRLDTQNDDLHVIVFWILKVSISPTFLRIVF